MQVPSSADVAWGSQSQLTWVGSSAERLRLASAFSPPVTRTAYSVPLTCPQGDSKFLQKNCLRHIILISWFITVNFVIGTFHHIVWWAISIFADTLLPLFLAGRPTQDRGERLAQSTADLRRGNMSARR